MQPVLIILRGVSGSGKSTFANFLADSIAVEGNVNHEYHYEVKPRMFEADMWFVDNDEPWNPRFLQTAHEWCQAEVRKSLQDGYITIVSNTTTTKKELDPYIKIATDLGVQYFVLIADGDFENVHDVPEKKVRQQAERFYFNNSAMQDNN